MTTTSDPFDALTVPGELNAILWNENKEEGESFRPLGLDLDNNFLIFHDSKPLDDEVPIPPPIVRSVIRASSILK
jgi:hypothetical protein